MIQSFNKMYLVDCYIPGFVLSTEKIIVNKTVPALVELMVSWKR